MGKIFFKTFRLKEVSGLFREWLNAKFHTAERLKEHNYNLK